MRVIAAAALAVFLMSGTAHAQGAGQIAIGPGLPMVCGEKSMMIDDVLKSQGQIQILAGKLLTNARPAFLYANRESGQLTVVIEMADDTACFIAMITTKPHVEKKGT